MSTTELPLNMTVALAQTQVSPAVQSAFGSSLSMFPNAAGFEIGGGTFVSGNMHIHHTNPDPGQTSTSLPLNVSEDTLSESEIYCNHLLGRKRGFPLFVPGPPSNLPSEYRTDGIAIGDVGRVTPQGIFDFFFNIYLPADDPINANIPDDFIPLSPYDSADVIPYDFDPGNYVSSPSIHEIMGDFSVPDPGGQFVFRCTEPTGAVLALPYGAHQQKLENLRSMRQYAAKHAESWYKYVNETRGRELVNGSLCLITGHEKAKSWGMATFQNVPLQNGFHLSFGPTANLKKGFRHRWQGTHCLHKHADSVNGSPLNQTTFIHAFTISVNEGIWGKLFGGAEVSQLVDSSVSPCGNKPGCGFVPYGSQGSSSTWPRSFFGGGATPGGKQCAGQNIVHENGTILSDAAPVPQIFHPSQIIHERIFREAPQAAVVITHDDDWCDVLSDDDTLGQNYAELPRAIFERFEIIEEHGAVFLQAKAETTTRSSPVPQMHAVAPRTRSFTFDPSHPSFRSGTHSDTTSERPRFSLQLQSSAIDDAFSPLFDHSPYGSIPSSLAHSGHDPHSPMPPFAAGDLLLPPATMYGHSNASFSSSEGSTDWGQSSGEMGGSFYDEHPQSMPSNGALHPPMLSGGPFWGGDGTFLTLPSPAMYRRPHASSFDGSETSSIRSPSPNPLWDHASPFGGSDLEDIWNSHDNASISPTHSSNETERATCRQGEDLPFLMNQRLQLQDGPPAVTSGYPAPADFDSHTRGTSTEHLLRQQRPANIIIAGPSQSFKIEDGISSSEWHGGSVEEKFHYGYWPSRQGEDPAHLLNQQPQLQDDHAVATGGYLGSQDFAMYLRGTSTEYLAPHSGQQRPPDIAIASSSTEGGSSPSDEPIKKLDNFKVATKAACLAAAHRRKDKKRRAPHVCGICGPDFTAKHNLRHHIDSHNSVRPFKCGKCTLRFGTKHTMTRHERKCENGPDSKPAI